LSSGWIAGCTADVSWSRGSLAPDRDPGKVPPQAPIVLGRGRWGSMAWAAGWKIGLIGCWTMGTIGASPGKRRMGLVGAVRKPLDRRHRLLGVLRWSGRALGSRGWTVNRLCPVDASKPFPCGGGAALPPTQRPRAGPARCRRGAPLRLGNAFLLVPPGPNRRPGRKMSCSDWSVGSVHPVRDQVRSGILLHWSQNPLPVGPCPAPPAAADRRPLSGPSGQGTPSGWAGPSPGRLMDLKARSPGAQGDIDRTHQFARNLQGHFLG
jgi:hypothetical protein